jgi:hypothetical protein
VRDEGAGNEGPREYTASDHTEAPQLTYAEAAGPGSRAEPGALGDEAVIVAAGPAAGEAGEVSLHGELPVRGSKRVPRSPISEGRFGRMFRRLRPMAPLSNDELLALSEQMREPSTPSGWNGTLENLDNPDIPAGYTYLGQFIDHDITFDPTSTLQRQNDPDALVDFRSPRFDLDSIYGSGPIDEPFQYRRGTNGMRMLLGQNANGDPDLPRNVEGTALIGDPRNDENTIVSQLQLLFLGLHDKFAAEVEADTAVPDEERFFEVQRRVRWHYQWVVAHDYVRRVVGDDTFNDIWVLKDGRVDVIRRHYKPKTMPYMPVEFSAAAFRFGHSQVRGIYNLSRNVTDRPIFVPGPLQNDFQDLRGFRPLPQQWTVEWPLFFSIDGSTPQPSRLVDAKLATGLFDLPDGGGSLALRNLKRSQVLGLPSGQDVANAVKADVLDTADLGGAPEPTPLWFYILKESEVTAGGRHLGPVGGRIVGEVLLGLVELDPRSWFSQEPAWTPTITVADTAKGLQMADLVKFATG